MGRAGTIPSSQKRMSPGFQHPMAFPNDLGGEEEKSPPADHQVEGGHEGQLRGRQKEDGTGGAEGFYNGFGDIFIRQGDQPLECGFSPKERPDDSPRKGSHFQDMAVIPLYPGFNPPGQMWIDRFPERVQAGNDIRIHHRISGQWYWIAFLNHIGYVSSAEL